jgi:hypothetical protein
MLLLVKKEEKISIQVGKTFLEISLIIQSALIYQSNKDQVLHK